MKLNYKLIPFLLLLCFNLVKAQNHWKEFNNKPVKKTTYYNTNQSLDTTSYTTKTELYYYPNGLIKMNVLNHPEYQIFRYYFYEDFNLKKIVEKVKDSYGSFFTVDDVTETHENIFLKKAKRYRYDFFTDEIFDEEQQDLTYTYNRKNKLIQTVIKNTSNDDYEYFEVENKSYKKDFVDKSDFKVFKVNANINDTIVEYVSQSNYTILSKNKIGPTAFKIINSQDTIYQKVNYQLYSKKELKNEDFDYFQVSDLLSFDVNELKSKDLSASGFELLFEYCKDGYTANSDIENQENRFDIYKEVFFNYVGKLFDNQQFEEAFEVTDRLLQNPNYFKNSIQLAFSITAFRVTFDHEIWQASKKYAYKTLSLLENENNNKVLVKLIQAQLCEVHIMLEEKEKAKKVLSELEEFKIKIKSDLEVSLASKDLTEKVAEDLLTFYDYDFRLANLYFLLNQKQKAIELLQVIIDETIKIDEAGYFFMRTYELNENSRYLLDEIKQSDE